MKRLVMLFALVLGCSYAAFAANDNYTIDDQAIETLFNDAAEVSVADAGLMNFTPAPFGTTEGTAFNAQLSSANPWAAWALCWVLGGFGIHRHYMGTSKWMWAYYLFTCGGIFGVVWVVDWVVLLVGAIEGNISSYTNNDSFFMWL